MKAEIKNVAASVRAKLANVAKAAGRPFDAVLLLYMQERLLYRLSMSRYVNNFVLKGGLLMFMFADFKGRPTKDIDFLARQISNDLDTVKSIFQEICVIECADDGLIFNAESAAVETIKEGAEYEGIRVKISCFLGKARKSLQLDIGFGDVVTPKPRFMEYPVMLGGDAPNIKVYSAESIISEKFHAMIILSVANSRMKDFYDIFTLLITNSFDGETLQQAIFETFKRRDTVFEQEIIIFSSSFSESQSRKFMWNAFLKKINMPATPFEEVKQEITALLKPIYNAILNDEKFKMKRNNAMKGWSNST